MRNAGLDEAQAGIKIARRNINNLRYANDSTLMAESEEELKSLFSFSWLSTIKVVSSAHLKLLIFLQAILIPSCISSSLAFCMIYSTLKLNKISWVTIYSVDVLFPDFEPVHCSMSSSNW